MSGNRLMLWLCLLAAVVVVCDLLFTAVTTTLSREVKTFTADQGIQFVSGSGLEVAVFPMAGNRRSR